MVWLKARMTKTMLAQSGRGLRRPLHIELLEDRLSRPIDPVGIPQASRC
jgi:hypothetical protein